MPDVVRYTAGLAIIFIGAAIASTRARFLVDLLLTGRPDPERFEEPFQKIKAQIVKVLGQKKLFQWTLPGLLHALTFWGFLVVQITLIESR